MKRIASREIPTYFELESSLLSSSIIAEKTALISVLNDPTKGNIMDKSRLLCLITISLCQMASASANDYKPSNINIINSKYTIENAYEDAFITGCMAILQTSNPATEGVKVDVTTLEQVCCVTANLG